MKKKKCVILCGCGLAIGFGTGMLVNQNLWIKRLDGIVEIIKQDMIKIVEEGDNISSYRFTVDDSKFLFSPIAELITTKHRK